MVFSVEEILTSIENRNVELRNLVEYIRRCSQQNTPIVVTNNTNYLSCYYIGLVLAASKYTPNEEALQIKSSPDLIRMLFVETGYGLYRNVIEAELAGDENLLGINGLLSDLSHKTLRSGGETTVTALYPVVMTIRDLQGAHHLREAGPVPLIADQLAQHNVSVFLSCLQEEINITKFTATVGFMGIKASTYIENSQNKFALYGLIPVGFDLSDEGLYHQITGDALITCCTPLSELTNRETYNEEYKEMVAAAGCEMVPSDSSRFESISQRIDTAQLSHLLGISSDGVVATFFLDYLADQDLGTTSEYIGRHIGESLTTNGGGVVAIAGKDKQAAIEQWMIMRKGNKGGHIINSSKSLGMSIQSGSQGSSTQSTGSSRGQAPPYKNVTLGGNNNQTNFNGKLPATIVQAPTGSTQNQNKPYTVTFGGASGGNIPAAQIQSGMILPPAQMQSGMILPAAQMQAQAQAAAAAAFQTVPYLPGYSRVNIASALQNSIDHQKNVQNFLAETGHDIQNRAITAPGGHFADVVSKVTGSETGKEKFNKAVDSLRDTTRAIKEKAGESQANIYEAISEMDHIKNARAVLQAMSAIIKENNTGKVDTWDIHFSNGKRLQRPGDNLGHLIKFDLSTAALSKLTYERKDKIPGTSDWIDKQAIEIDALPNVFQRGFDLDKYCPKVFKSLGETEDHKFPSGLIDATSYVPVGTGFMGNRCDVRIITNDPKAGFFYQKYVLASWWNEKKRETEHAKVKVGRLVIIAPLTDEEKQKSDLKNQSKNYKWKSVKKPGFFQKSVRLPKKYFTYLAHVKRELGNPNNGYFTLSPFLEVGYIPGGQPDQLATNFDGDRVVKPINLKGRFLDYQIQYTYDIKKIDTQKSMDFHLENEIQFLKAESGYRSLYNQQVSNASYRGSQTNPNQPIQNRIMQSIVKGTNYGTRTARKGGLKRRRSSRGPIWNK